MPPPVSNAGVNITPPSNNYVTSAYYVGGALGAVATVAILRNKSPFLYVPVAGIVFLASGIAVSYATAKATHQPWISFK